MPKAQLAELYAHALGVIEEARLDFRSGFNVLTGETGAGKTLLLGALDLCLGGESSSSRHALRTDTKVAAIFTRADSEEVVLTREATPSGRLRSSLNSLPSSAEALSAVAAELIVIHGQHDSLALKNKSEILRIVDSAGNVDVAELRDVRIRLHEAVTLRDSFGGSSEQREREIDFLRFQVEEIDTSKIVGSQELTETIEKLTELTERQDGKTGLLRVLEILDGDDQSVMNGFGQALQSLPRSPSFDDIRTQLKNNVEQLRETAHGIRLVAEQSDYDEELMRTLEERAGVLQAICRKYGGSLEEVLRHRNSLAEQLENLVSATERLATIDKEIAELTALEAELSRRARKDREYAAVQLTQAVRKQLPRVALGSASLRFEVDGDDGSDTQILFTPNPGQPEGPLQALASGGELSRVLLAISLETAPEDVVAVFDEIDTGVGGQVAQHIGECLRELGHRQQVLAVTHLASVAAKADHHFVIEKVVANGQTATTVREVTGEERTLEIARMLAGSDLSSESLALASRLLETSS
jgi:DNA repair protein RecN (Recombination protein N)